MRWSWVFTVLTAAAAAAMAVPPEPGHAAPAKGAKNGPVNVPAGRRVGDTIETPFVIPEFPFATSGTTAGFTHDYDAACPDRGSAPDVVYRFEPTADVVVRIDLCGSAYDTQLFIFDAGHSLLACNDDYHYGPACGEYASRIDNLAVEAGETYYVVVDGYGTAFGAYELAIADASFYAVESCGGDVEGEPPLRDGYVDNFNGGCNSTPPVYGSYASPSYFINDCLDGKTGWYQTDGMTHRDTDWYRWQDVPSGRATFTLYVEQPTQFSWVSIPDDCSTWHVLTSRTVGPSVPVSIQVDVQPGASCLLCIAPADAEPPAGFTSFEYDWQLHWSVAGSFLPAELPLGEREQADNRMMHRWSGASVALGGFADDMSGDRSCDGPATPGPDGLAAVYLQAGEVLEITNDPPIYPADADDRVDMITYSLLTDLREGPGSCAGTHSCAAVGQHTFAFTAAETGWHYLVLDGEVAGADPRVAFRTRCRGTEPPRSPAHDTCYAARTLAPGPIDLADDLTEAVNDFDPGEAGTYGRWRTGRDVVYQFAAALDETLNVTMTGAGDWDEELYVVADCADSPMSCLAVGVADAAGGAHLIFAAPATATYWLVCDSFGVGERSFRLTGILGSVPDPLPIVDNVVLEPCRPNPFNPQSTIVFALPETAPCKLAIYALNGRCVRTLLDSWRAAGRHEIVWDGCDDTGARLPSGSYVVRVASRGVTRSVQVTLVK